MDWDDYEKQAMRTIDRKQNKKNQLITSILGLNGEIGEVTDIIKKYLYHGHDLNIESLKEEIGDVLWYLALLTNTLDLDMEEIKLKNIKKLKKRYKNGFSKEASINRDQRDNS